MKLSLHFLREEFACPCCGACPVESRLVAGLETLRSLLISYDCHPKPIIITSGYRCPEHNKSIGGVSNSQHLYANAADIIVPGVPVMYVYQQAIKVNSFARGGIGIYRAFLHVDVRSTGLARWREKGLLPSRGDQEDPQ